MFAMTQLHRVFATVVITFHLCELVASAPMNKTNCSQHVKAFSPTGVSYSMVRRCYSVALSTMPIKSLEGGDTILDKIYTERTSSEKTLFCSLAAAGRGYKTFALYDGRCYSDSTADKTYNRYGYGYCWYSSLYGCRYYSGGTYTTNSARCLGGYTSCYSKCGTGYGDTDYMNVYHFKYNYQISVWLRYGEDAVEIDTMFGRNWKDRQAMVDSVQNALENKVNESTLCGLGKFIAGQSYTVFRSFENGSSAINVQFMSSYPNFTELRDNLRFIGSLLENFTFVKMEQKTGRCPSGPKYMYVRPTYSSRYLSTNMTSPTTVYRSSGYSPYFRIYTCVPGEVELIMRRASVPGITENATRLVNYTILCHEKYTVKYSWVYNNYCKIPPRTLPYGIYYLETEAWFPGEPTLSTFWYGFMKISPGPLYAYISGSYYKYQAEGVLMFINGTASYDPEEYESAYDQEVAIEKDQEHTRDLNYTWVCYKSGDSISLSNIGSVHALNTVDISDNVTTAATSGGCFQTGPGRLNITGPRGYLNTSKMVAGYYYYLVLFIEKDTRYSRYTQRIRIVTKPPEYSITCINNCFTKMKPGSRLMLRAICKESSCGSPYHYVRWRMEFDSGRRSAEEGLIYWYTETKFYRYRLTPSRSFDMLLEKNFAEIGKTYRAVLNVYNGGAVTKAFYTFITNSPPKNGTSEIYPTRGKALVEFFTFVMSDWVDEDLPLSVEIWMLGSRHRQDSIDQLLYYGSNTSVTLRLPVGNSTDNFQVELMSIVLDSFASGSRYYINATVEAPDDPVGEMLTIMNDPGGVLATGDDQEKLQLCLAGLSLLDDQFSGNATVEDKTKSRDLMVNAVAQMQPNGTQGVTQVTGTLIDCTSNSKELSAESQVASLGAAGNLTSFLGRESNSTDIDTAVIDTAAGYLIHLCGNILDGTVNTAFQDSNCTDASTTDDNTTAVSCKEKMQNLTLKSLNTADEVGSIILERMTSGEPMKNVTSPMLIAILAKSTVDNIPVLFGFEVGGIEVPDVSPLLQSSAGTTPINWQSTMLAVNPFIFSNNVNQTSRVDSSVLTLSLKMAHGKEIGVNNSDEPFVIKIPIKKRESSSEYLYFVNPGNILRMHKFKISHDNTAFDLVIKLKEEVFVTVYVRYGAWPNWRDHDYALRHPDLSSCVEPPPRDNCTGVFDFNECLGLTGGLNISRTEHCRTWPDVGFLYNTTNTRDIGKCTGYAEQVTCPPVTCKMDCNCTTNLTVNLRHNCTCDGNNTDWNYTRSKCSNPRLCKNVQDFLTCYDISQQRYHECKTLLRYKRLFYGKYERCLKDPYRLFFGLDEYAKKGTYYIAISYSQEPLPTTHSPSTTTSPATTSAPSTNSSLNGTVNATTASPVNATATYLNGSLNATTFSNTTCGGNETSGLNGTEGSNLTCVSNITAEENGTGNATTASPVNATTAHSNASSTICVGNATSGLNAAAGNSSLGLNATDHSLNSTCASSTTLGSNLTVTLNSTMESISTSWNSTDGSNATSGSSDGHGQGQEQGQGQGQNVFKRDLSAVQQKPTWKDNTADSMPHVKPLPSGDKANTKLESDTDLATSNTDKSAHLELQTTSLPPPYIDALSDIRNMQTFGEKYENAIPGTNEVLSRVRRASSPNRIPSTSSRLCAVVEEKPPPTYSPPPPTIPPVIQQVYNASSSVNYTLDINLYSCLYWDVYTEEWSTKGCKPHTNSTPDLLVCTCTHLTSFGGGALVALNPIDFDQVFANFANIGATGNVSVISTIAGLFLVYALAVVWARHADKRDENKAANAIVMKGDPKQGWYNYKISVYTGTFQGSGTTANAAMIVTGEIHDSPVIPLTDAYGRSEQLLSRCHVAEFILSTPVTLGHLNYIKVWHNNAGIDPSWFLRQVTIEDIQTGRKMFYFCNSWLALDKGDRKIERVIYTADEKEIGKFRNLFYLHTAKSFSDKHLWMSIVLRSPSNPFTRVQRVTCCLSLCLCAMLANAMFYENESEGPQGKLTIGPITFSLRQLMIGIQSAVVVVPLNLLIIFMFRNARPKASKREKYKEQSAICSEPQEHSLEEGHPEDVQEVKLWKKRFSLPRGFVYVAYTLCVVTCLTSATFVLFYSMMWGTDKSNNWIISVLISLFQDILLIQPIKVIVTAVLLSLVVRKPPEEEKNDDKTCVFKKKEETDYIAKFLFEDTHHEPLDEDDVTRIRDHTQKKNTVKGMFREIAFHLVFYAALSTTILGVESSYRYPLANHIQNVFKHSEKVWDSRLFWQWCETYLVPGLYDTTWYNGGPFTHEENFISSKKSFLVGMPRMRQTRVKRVKCEATWKYSALQEMFPYCYPSYSLTNADSTSAASPLTGNATANLNDTVLNAELGFERICLQPLMYQTAEQLGTLPVVTDDATYEAGGLVSDLGYELLKATEVIQNLKEDNWIQRNTRAIFVEFIIFEPASRLYVFTRFSFEIKSTGKIFPSVRTEPLAFYGTGNTLFDGVVTTCNVILAIMIAYSLISEAFKIYKQRLSYFKYIWNIVEILMLAFAIATAALLIVKATYVQSVVKKVQANPFGRMSFDYVVAGSDVYKALASLVIFLATIKLLKLLKVNEKIVSFVYVIQHSKPFLISISILFFVAFMAFAMLGNLVFGNEVLMYSTVLRSLVNEFEMILGKGVVFHELKEVSPRLGPFFVFCYFMITTLLLVNFFVTILNDSYEESQEELQHDADVILVAFMSNYLKRSLRDISTDLKRVGGKKDIRPPSLYDRRREKAKDFFLY